MGQGADQVPVMKMSLRWTRWCIVLGISTLAACAREQPSAPVLHSITGHLRLTGYFVDADGQFAGTRVLGDADGVTVELLHGSEIVGRTTTVGGIYRFTGLGPGDYVARSRVIGDIGDQTTPMVIAVADVSAADTLRLVARGDLMTVPNPFVYMTTVNFVAPDTMWVDLEVLDVGGNPVMSLMAHEVLPGHHAVFWYGRDQMDRRAAGSLFWVTYAAGHDVRAQLLFRQGVP